MGLRVQKMKTLSIGFMQSGFLEEVYNQTTVDYWKNELIWPQFFKRWIVLFTR